LAVLVVLVIVLPWVLGALMAREHLARGEAVIDAPIAQVWESVSGFDSVGEWAPDVANMTRVTDVEGLPSYEMHGGSSIITFTFTEVSPPHRLVVELVDNSDSYGGVWTYQLEAVGDGTRVTITEDGWTEPAYFRFVLWVFGRDRTIKGYLNALQRKHAGS
jgi:uncharacterized protein YndB with AHSA1/START domain